MLLALSLVLAAAPLDEARRDYADLDYEQCVAKLSNLRAVPARDRAAASLVLGLCHFALGHERKARGYIEGALRRAPGLTAPANASPKERELIDELRAVAATAEPPRKVRKGKRPAPADEPEPPASEPQPPAVTATDQPPPEELTPPVAPTPPVAVAEPARDTPPKDAPPKDAPVVAALTPPAREPPPAVVAPAAPGPPVVPLVLGGVAVVAAGAGAGLGLWARGQEAQAVAEPVQVDAGRLRDGAQNTAIAANVAFGVAGTAAAGALVTWLLR